MKLCGKADGHTDALSTTTPTARRDYRTSSWPTLAVKTTTGGRRISENRVKDKLSRQEHTQSETYFNVKLAGLTWISTFKIIV